MGVFCDGGLPILSTSIGEARCSSEAARSASFFFDVEVLGEAREANRNPVLGAGAIRLDDGPWSEVGDPCDASEEAAVRVKAGSRHTIRIDAAGAAERVDAGSSEPLTIAHYVTRGDLEGHFSAIESGDRPVVEVAWRAPSNAPAEGEVMHFYAVVRDARGGASWEHRTSCVVDGNVEQAQ